MKKIVVLCVLLGVMFIGGVDFSVETEAEVSYVLEYQLMDTFRNDFFAHQSQVSVLESFAIVHRVLESAGVVDPTLIQEYRSTYEGDLNRLGIPETLPPFSYDLHDAMGYAIGMGTLSVESLEDMLEGDLLKRMDKETFATVMGKTLNHYLNEDLSSIIALTYKDDAEISLDARRCIMFLVDQGVLTGKGDADGNFNPDALVTREMMAGFASRLHQVILSKVVGTGLEYPEEELVVEGIVKEIHIKETPELTLLDFDGNIRTYAASRAVDYEHGLYDLRLNQEVEVTVSPEGIVKIALIPRILVEPTGLEVEIVKVYDEVNLLMTKDRVGNRRLLSFPESRGVKASYFAEGSWIFVRGILLHEWLYEVHWISIVNP